jgi:cytochrome c biogenesis protein CcmG/thiol:disulfide interchange protein DsbE
MRILPFVMFLCLSAAMAIMLVYKDDPARLRSEDERPFPALTLTTLDGKQRWDSTTVRGRVTLVNFFASWCAPCITEMPEFAALKKDFPNLHLAGIAWNDDPDILKKWLSKHGKPFDSVWLDAKGDATINLGIKGIPETFVVDAAGVIRYRITGPLTEAEREATLDALLTTLAKEAQDAR